MHLNLKQYIRYEMRFEGNWPGICVGCMGLSFFLRILYYFGLVHLQDIGGGETFFSLILPLLFSCAFIVLFRVVKWNAPGIFAILGSVFCLLLIIWNFSSGDFLRIILSVFMYIIAAAVLLATAGGYLPGNLVSTAAFAIILVFRFLLYSMGQSGLSAYIAEFSSLCLIASLLALTRCFKPHIRQNDVKGV